MIAGEDRFKRLRWLCRRGMKELDVLLEAFLEQHHQALLDGGWTQLEKLLSQEDDVLFDWVSGRDLPTDPATLKLIGEITHVA